jgi:dipeptidyl aminopeptidase/acylaminoacyl peptidase
LASKKAKSDVQKRPITPDDLFAVNIVGDPQLSPDGKQVAYVVTRVNKEADTYRAAIWLAPVAGGEPVRLTSGVARDTSPRWSPDGQSIAFVSNRAGLPALDGEGKPVQSKNGKPANQIWTIELGGGEASQITRREFGASAPEWSPDGRTIAFLSPTAPKGEPGVPDSPHEQIADERVITKIRYRFDGRGFLDRFSHIFVVQAGGGEAKQLTFGDVDDAEITWTPDGRAIAFVSDRSDNRELDRKSLIYQVPATGGEVRCLTPGSYAFGEISFSPDGTRIAAIGGDDPISGGAKNANVWTVAATGGTPENHSKAYDRSIGDSGMGDMYFGGEARAIWSGKNSVLVQVSDHGATNLVRVSLDKGAVKQITKGARRITGVSAGEKVLAYVSGDGNTPFELFVSDADGGNERQLSNHNADFLAEVHLSPAEEITFRSQAGDRDIQGWILKPYGFKKSVKYPAIVQIHGGPHAMYGQALFHEMQLMAARGYVVLFTNPRGSQGYGEDFNTTTRGRWGESDQPDILGGLDALIATGYVDENRVGVTGGSYGGYLTNWLIGHTDRFRAAVTQRCVSNLYSMIGTSDIGFNFGVYEFGGLPWAETATLARLSPVTYVDKINTPLLIIHNEHDFRCPIEQAEQMYTFLKMQEKEVAFVRIPDENHNLSRTGTPSRRLARLHHMIAWFDSHL